MAPYDALGDGDELQLGCLLSGWSSNPTTRCVPNASANLRSVVTLVGC